MKIDLAKSEYKFVVMVLNMENGTKTYSMLLGRPWLKYTKTNHYWGDKFFTVTVGKRTVTMSTIKKFFLKPLERPKYVDNGYDWEEGLSDEEEQQLYNAIHELWHVGEVAPKESYFLKEIDYGMLQP